NILDVPIQNLVIEYIRVGLAGSSPSADRVSEPASTDTLDATSKAVSTATTASTASARCISEPASTSRAAEPAWLSRVDAKTTQEILEEAGIYLDGDPHGAGPSPGDDAPSRR